MQTQTYTNGWVTVILTIVTTDRYEISIHTAGGYPNLIVGRIHTTYPAAVTDFLQTVASEMAEFGSETEQEAIGNIFK